MPRRNSSRFVTVSQQEFESWLMDLPFSWGIVEDDRAKEYIYEVLAPTGSSDVSVRIYSSVDKRTGLTRDIGTDAIRIVYWDRVNDMPIGAGKKLLRTNSAASTIEDRLRRRVNDFFSNIDGVHPVDLLYVRFVLEQYIEHVAHQRSKDFAGSMLQQLRDRGRLSSKQIAYIVGQESPSGFPTFEEKLNTWGFPPRETFEEEVDDESLEDAMREFEAARSDRPIEDIGRARVRRRNSPTGRHSSSEPSIQTLPRNQRNQEDIEHVLDGARRQIAARRGNQNLQRHLRNILQHDNQTAGSLLSVNVEEESDRMVDELDNFVRGIDGPPVEEVIGNEDLVPTRDLDDRDNPVVDISYPFEFFNPVQSRVYNEAMNEDTNLVIGANTSAGKTVCAELLMLKALEHGDRVVYLSPLKSLTQEKYHDWQRTFPECNIAIMTGDYVLSKEKKEELDEADIIVMTSEMCDSRTRRMRREGNEWLYEVGVLVVDEAHILTTDRGHAVESGVMRFTALNPDARVLLLSATMPNVQKLGVWLTTLNEKETQIIKSSWRPVELHMNFPQYMQETYASGRVDYFATQENKMQLAVDIVNSAGKEDQKFLVFVHDKNTGRRLLRKFTTEDIEAHFHNADLDMEQRLDIEKKFSSKRRGSLRVLISTSTLAWGRNLPARNVIIVGAHRGIQEVDPLDLIQMAGRAGRYGIDEQGDVYMLTPNGHVSLYQNMLTNPRDIVSVLAVKETLAFHMLAEVQNGVVTSEPTFIEWYKRSFAYTARPNIDSLVPEVFGDMLRLDMVEQNDRGIHCTQLGNVCGWLYYSPYDVSAWHKNFSAIFTGSMSEENEPLRLAWALANIPSFDMGYCPKNLQRASDRLAAALAADAIGMDAGCTVNISAAFAMITGVEPDDGAVKAGVRSIAYDLGRMLNAIQLIDKKHAQWGADWAVIGARVRYGIGPELVPLVSIPGVGGVRAKKLFEHGLTSVRAVASPTGKKKMLRIFKPALVNKIHNAAKKIRRQR